MLKTSEKWHSIMTNFKEIKEAIMFANEHLVSGGFFNNITLSARSINNHNNYNNSSDSSTVNIIEHLYNWSLTPITKERTRLFYLFGDFGSGKSGICKELVSKLHEEYEASRYGDTMAKPTLPLYFNLKVLTGIYGDFEFANKSLAELLEVMFRSAGIPTVNGDDIIKLVRQYPCIVVFDGFDEAVQKLAKSQQNGFLNKLLSILPNVQYTKDLMRIVGQPVEESTIPDSPSRLVISCRSQLFESQQEQDSFIEAFYNTELSINGNHNYQAYKLVRLESYAVRKSFQHAIHSSNQNLVPYQRLDLNHEDSKTFVDYLIDLSINPLLMSLAQSLLPSIKPSLDKTGFINSAEMFTNLITKLMQRDSGKSIINIKEKQKILGAVALEIWQGRTGFISLEGLRQFFFNSYKEYRQIQLGIDTGRVELETALQDLHSSMIIRDDSDMYFFCQPLIFNYFLAVGIFETVMNAKNNIKKNDDFANSSVNSIADFVFSEVKSSDGSITLIDTLNIDSLFFVSQMVISFIIRRDMNSYHHFYQQWLVVCEQVAKTGTHSDTTAENQALNKALEMWEIVIGEELPGTSYLSNSN